MQTQKAHSDLGVSPPRDASVNGGGDAFPIKFRVLGPLEVLDEGRPMALGGPQERSLLGLLLTHFGEVVSSDRLIDAMWGEHLPRDPQHALQAAVSRLRKALQGGSGKDKLLVARAPGYVLDVEPENVDAPQFERMVDEARRLENPAARAVVFEEALALWRGPALADVSYEPWAQAEITRLEEVRLGAVEDEIDAHIALGRHAEVLGRLRGLVEKHPLRERPPAQLMLALYRAGRQAEALEIYEKTRVALAEELGVDPGPELQQLHRDVLRQNPSLDWARPAPISTNLPERVTSFVGRDEETKLASKLLAEGRLVSFTGPGGSGKTRLAIEMGAALAAGYRDGVWLVDLAPLTDVSSLPKAVSDTLRVPEDPVRPATDTLVDFLRQKRLLLILDNCEHLIEASAHLADRVLSATPDVTILATSREALAVPGEAVLDIPPLAVPDAVAGEADPEEIVEYDAIRLFVDRVAAALPGFTLTRDNVRWVVEICARLEGLPLALELAAARVRGLGVEAIASRLGDQFRLLTGGRRTGLPKERTFRATVDWSYDLLNGSERRVFERLSVFAGDFSLEGAEAVASGEAIESRDVPDLVARLVDRSLVRRIGSSHIRYRMLEPLRQYASERLATRSGTASARRRHMEFFLALAQTAEPALRGKEQGMWLDRLEDEHDNLRAALASATGLGEANAGLRLAAALGPFWRIRGHFSEGRENLRLMLSTGRQLSPVRARALVEEGFLAFFQCDYDDALMRTEEALELYRRAGDRWGIAYTLAVLGLAAWKLGDGARAKASFDESLGSFRVLDDGWGVATALGCLGFVAVGDGLVEEAERAYDESLAWFRDHGNDSGVALALSSMGGLAAQRGDLDRGEEWARESLGLTQEVGDRWGTARALSSLARIAMLRGRDRDAADLYIRALCMFAELGDREDSATCLEGLAAIAWRDERPSRAAELLGAAEAQRGLGTEFSLTTIDPVGYDSKIADLRSRLGEGPFNSAWTRGRGLMLDQAYGFALHPHHGER
jgi:predicted ATPase/DNA-binding SARP family transcriptional activator